VLRRASLRLYLGRPRLLGPGWNCDSSSQIALEGIVDLVVVDADFLAKKTFPPAAMPEQQRRPRPPSWQPFPFSPTTTTTTTTQHPAAFPTLRGIGGSGEGEGGRGRGVGRLEGLKSIEQFGGVHNGNGADVITGGSGRND